MNNQPIVLLLLTKHCDAPRRSSHDRGIRGAPVGIFPRLAFSQTRLFAYLGIVNATHVLT